jgi:hypothetical protein
MLTLLSNKELDQLRSYVDSINTLLDQAQTIQVEVDRSSQKAVQVSDTRESQSKTRVSRRKGKRGVSVLNEGQVAEIKRQLAVGGKSAARIAREFGVHITTINCIKWGKTWKNVKAAETKPLEILEIRK